MSNLPAGAENDPNAPWNQEEQENECSYCGEPCGKDFCNKECYIAELND